MSEMNCIESEFCVEFGKRLRQARTMARLSRTKLAAAIEVHRNTISRWEEGDGSVTLFMVLRIVGILRVDIQYLIPLSMFIWGRDVPKRERPLVRFGTIQAERDPPLTAKERGL